MNRRRGTRRLNHRLPGPLDRNHPSAGTVWSIQILSSVKKAPVGVGQPTLKIDGLTVGGTG